MATLAVFIALGGVGYAAMTLPKNSVKAKQIAKNAVKRPEVATGGIASTEVLDRSLQAADFAPGQLPAGEPGAKGEQGPPGPTFAQFKDDGDPVASPDFLAGGSNLSTTIDTPAPGRLMVILANPGVSVDCTAGPVEAGLYVDSVPVPNTRRMFGDGSLTPLTIFGVTEALPAAPHTVNLGYNCPTGDFNGSTAVADSELGAVLLGG